MTVLLNWEENIVGEGENAGDQHFLLFHNVFKRFFPLGFNPFPNGQILNSSKLKEFADDNFKIHENGTEFSKWLENTSNFSFSHSVFKRLVSQGRQKVSLCGNGLKVGNVQ